MEKIKDGSHIPEDILEEIALGRRPQRDVPRVFEHLLDCEACNELYEQQVTFCRNLQAATALNERQAESRHARSWLSGILTPGPAWAAAGALVVLAAFIPMLRDTPAASSIQTVDLTAMRGGEPVARQSGSALELRLDASGLPASRAVKVQIVDASGSEMWAGAATSSGERWLVRPERTFAAGQYWVRVYGPGGTGDPLREFSLILR